MNLFECRSAEELIYNQIDSHVFAYCLLRKSNEVEIASQDL